MMPARFIRSLAVLVVVLGTWSLAPVSAAPTTNKACTGGKAGVYPCQYVDLLAFIPLADLGGGEASDIWGWKDLRRRTSTRSWARARARSSLT